MGVKMILNKRLKASVSGLLLLPLILSINVDAAPQPWWQETTPNYNSVTLERVVALKRRADEFSRVGDNRVALEIYEDALRNHFHYIDVESLSPEEAIAFELVGKELDYRIFLVQQNFGFYGGVEARVPQSPKVRLLALESRHQALLTLLAEIDKIDGELEKDEIDLSGNRADLAAYGEKLETEILTEEIQTIQFSRQEQLILQAKSDLDSLRLERNRLEKKSDNLFKDLEAAAAQASQIGEQLAIQAMGVPEAELLNSNQKLEDRLLNYVSSSDTAIVKAINASALEEYNTLAETIAKIDETVQTVELVQETAQDVAKFIENPSINQFQKLGAAAIEQLGDEEQKLAFNAAQQLHAAIENPSKEKLIDLSQQIYGMLDERDKKSIKAFVESRLPIETALHIAKRSKEAEEILETTLQVLNENTLEDIAEEFLGSPELVDIIGVDPEVLWREALENLDVAKIKDEYALELLMLSVSIKPEVVLNLLENDEAGKVRAELAHKLGVSVAGVSEDVVVNGVFSKLESASLNSRIKVLDSLRVRVSGSKIVIRPTETRDRRHKIEVELAGLVAGLKEENLRLKRLIAKADEEYIEAFSLVLSNSKDTINKIAGVLEPDVIDKYVSQYLGSIGSSSTRNRKRKELWNGFESVHEQTYGVVATSALTSLKTKYQPSKKPELPVSEGGVNGRAPSDEQAMLMVGVTAAFPQLAIAKAALDFVGALSDMRKLAKEMNAVSDQIARSFTTERALLGQIANSRTTQEILKRKNAISAVRLRTARVQQAALDSALKIYQGSLKENRDKLAYKSPLLFFALEMMRQDFDLLEKSIATWTHGNSLAFRGEVLDQLRSNPDTLRFAVDPDIALYTWLNREGEGNRIDLVQLAAHWEKITTVAKEVCRTACDSSVSDLGEVVNNRTIRLSQLLSSNQWAEFKAWQTEQRDRSLFFVVPLHRGLNLVTDPEAYNVRVLEIAAAGCSEAGCDQTVHGFSLTHSGNGVIHLENGGSIVEWLPSQVQTSFDPDLPITSEIYRRFDDNVRAEGKKFAGYGFYTNYLVRIEPTRENKSLSDIDVKFAYYTQTSQRPRDEIAEYLFPEDSQVLPVIELVTVGRESDSGEPTYRPLDMHALSTYGKLDYLARLSREWAENGITVSTNLGGDVVVEDTFKIGVRPVCESQLAKFFEVGDVKRAYMTGENAVTQIEAIGAGTQRKKDWHERREKALELSRCFGVETYPNLSCPNETGSQSAKGDVQCEV